VQKPLSLEWSLIVIWNLNYDVENLGSHLSVWNRLFLARAGCWSFGFVYQVLRVRSGMIVYGAILIPIVAILVINFFYRHQIAWWECFLPMIFSVIVICLGKYGTEKSQITDIEYWTGYVVTSEYHDDWNEYVHQTCTRSCGDDCTETYDCSYIDYHPSYWVAIDNNSIRERVHETRYRQFAQLFGNEQQIGTQNGYTNDGPIYAVEWPGSIDTLQIMTTTHHYENRVQASHSVFNFPQVDPEKTKVFEYPSASDVFEVPSILTEVKDLRAYHAANRYLSILNAQLGRSKQIRVWFLIYGEESTLIEAERQEAYWKGGNKNEIVLCIGVNGQHEIQWCHLFSWTEEEALKIMVRNLIMEKRGQSIELMSIINDVRPLIADQWVRKQFADFSYLTVEPKPWHVFLIWLVTALVSAGACAYAVLNQYGEGEAPWKQRYRRLRRYSGFSMPRMLSRRRKMWG
jgi:hypothetical protein